MQASQKHTKPQHGAASAQPAPQAVPEPLSNATQLRHLSWSPGTGNRAKSHQTRPLPVGCERGSENTTPPQVPERLVSFRPKAICHTAPQERSAVHKRTYRGAGLAQHTAFHTRLQNRVFLSTFQKNQTPAKEQVRASTPRSPTPCPVGSVRQPQKIYINLLPNPLPRLLASKVAICRGVQPVHPLLHVLLDVRLHFVPLDQTSNVAPLVLMKRLPLRVDDFRLQPPVQPRSVLAGYAPWVVALHVLAEFVLQRAGDKRLKVAVGLVPMVRQLLGKDGGRGQQTCGRQGACSVRVRADSDRAMQ